MKSIKTKGMIFSLIIIIIMILVTGLSSYYQFKKVLVHEVNNAVVRVAKESADYLSNHIDQFVSPLVGLSENEDIKSMDWEKQKAILTSQINPTYQNIAVVDLTKTAYYTDDTSLDLSDREYVAGALEGNITFSDIIISRKTNNPAIMVAVPIKDDEVIKGALIARLDVDFLSNFATSRGYGKNGIAYVISSSGSLISRPEQEKSEDTYNLYDRAQEDSKYTSFSEFVKSCSGSQSGYGSYEFDGKRMLMGYASVEKTDWKIYIGTSEAESLKGLNGLKKIFFALIGISLLACTLAVWLFISRFARSIKELDNLFENGAKGDLTIRFTPKTKDEIGRVGISFNKMMDNIKTLTQYDPLTSLLNQYVLVKDVEVLMHGSNKQNFSLIMIAIDKFSFINETYGYTAGDIILKEVARRIIRCTAGNYQVYRYKGDEFMVLCPGETSEQGIDDLAKQILNSVRESYLVEDKTIEINISMGSFIWSEDTRIEEPIKAVTHAKNYAKKLGSNQVQKFNHKIYKDLQIMNELQADIINGLKEDQFFLVYQPLFYLGNEHLAEVEALIRWRHPQKGLLFPDQFIELSEQSGTIINIDQWVIDTACRQLKIWRDKKKAPIVLSINISAKSFETENFIPGLVETINKYDVDPTLLQLEITERMLIKNVEESISKLNELRAMGIHVAIDDFGTGYSSLSYIVRLPIDSVKIDKSFVRNINTSKEAKTIISTIINLCKILNLRVIAEGIENQQELDYLKSYQCDIGQGYYFSKPVSIAEIENKHLMFTELNLS